MESSPFDSCFGLGWRDGVGAGNEVITWQRAEYLPAPAKNPKFFCFEFVPAGVPFRIPGLILPSPFQPDDLFPQRSSEFLPQFLRQSPECFPYRKRNREAT